MTPPFPTQINQRQGASALREADRAAGGPAFRDTVTPSVFVGTVHAGNTSPKRTAGRRWVLHEGRQVEALLAADASVYRRLFGVRS